MKYVSMYNLGSKKLDPPTKRWKPSITQPDEALTIQQILDRVQHGLTTGIGGYPLEYDDDSDDDFDDPTLQPGFDKLDALELANSDLNEQAVRGKEEVKRKRAKKKHDDLIEEEVQRRMNERTPPAEEL